jgi:hypothetical protein
MDMDEFRSLLRTGASEIEFEGMPVRLCRGEPLAPGDTYLAGRNTGPHLLTVREVYEDQGFATNVENAYPFDLRHCIKVELLV